MNKPLSSFQARNSAPAKSHNDLSINLDNLCYTCCDQVASTELDSDKAALLLIKTALSKQQQNLNLLLTKLNQPGQDNVSGMATTPQMDTGIQTLSAKPSLSQAGLAISCQSELGNASTRKTWKRSKQFPQKLHDMLEIASAKGFGSSSNAVSWLHHGRAFKIHDEQTFMNSIVPKYFRQTKIRSFYRQLSIWGFNR